MPYNNVISRTDAAAMIPEEVARLVIQGVTEQSAALRLFRGVRVSRAQQRIPVISALPTAYFVNGDTGLKQTTEANWANVFMNVEEIAAIVPIPEAVIDDADFDVWGEIRPLLEEAIGRTLDAAIFFGVNKPASWPTDVTAAAVAAGNVLATGTNAQAAGGLAQDISDLFALVEADGFDVTGVVANRTMRGRVRSIRNTLGDRQDGGVSLTDWYGATPVYAMRGLWPTGLSAALAIAGDFTQGIIGVRQDITYKLLDQAVIQDNLGAIIYNLAQQDMVAMRVVARYAWAVPNPLNRDQPTEASRYPFGVLRTPAV